MGAKRIPSDHPALQPDSRRRDSEYAASDSRSHWRGLSVSHGRRQTVGHPEMSPSQQPPYLPSLNQATAPRRKAARPLRRQGDEKRRAYNILTHCIPVKPTAKQQAPPGVTRRPRSAHPLHTLSVVTPARPPLARRRLLASNSGSGPPAPENDARRTGERLTGSARRCRCFETPPAEQRQKEWRIKPPGRRKFLLD